MRSTIYRGSISRLGSLGIPLRCYHPLQRRARAESIIVCLHRDTLQGQEVVVFQLRLIFGKFHLLNTPIHPHSRGFDISQSLIFRSGFVVDVEVCQLLPGGSESPEVFSEGDMGQIALEVRFVFLAIVGVMQESVGIVEDVPFGEGVVLVVGSEVCQCPIGDVFTSVCAVFVVGVERKTLRIGDPKPPAITFTGISIAHQTNKFVFLGSY